MFDAVREALIKFDPHLFAKAAAGFADKLAVEDFRQLMAHRTVTGEYRFGAASWGYRDTDQEAVIGKGWRHGFQFFSTAKGLFETAHASKVKAYTATGNTELLVDIANYAMFNFIVGDWSEAKSLQVLSAAMREFFFPAHRGAHYEALDQGVDGIETSGSIINDPRIQTQFKNPARH